MTEPHREDKSSADSGASSPEGRRWTTGHLVAATVMSLLVGLVIGVTTQRNETDRQVATAGTSTSTAASTRGLTAPPLTGVRPATTASTAPLTGSRSNPVPLGQAGQPAGLAWRVRVLEVTQNANEVVRRANQFNKPPAEGRQFFLVKVELTYIGQGSESPGRVELRALGAAQVLYSDYQDSCGVIPDEYSQKNTVFTGGTIEGNACWSVGSEDVSTLLMLAGASFSSSGGAFFALA
jgi:hypothetical protein